MDQQENEISSSGVTHQSLNGQIKLATELEQVERLSTIGSEERL